MTAASPPTVYVNGSAAQTPASEPAAAPQQPLVAAVGVPAPAPTPLIDPGLHISWMALGGLLTLAAFILGLMGAVVKWSDRIKTAEGALKTADAAKAKAEEACSGLATFKAEVAGNYATKAEVQASESRVLAAIQRLTDRLDRILEQRHGQAE